MATKALVVYHYHQPKRTTRVVTLPEDWADYDDRERQEYFLDEAPVPDYEVDHYDVVLDSELRGLISEAD